MCELYNVKTPSSQSGHAKHMLIMAVCCGTPILLLAGIGIFGISYHSLEMMILLICPIGMGIMMWLMMKENKPKKMEAKEEIKPTTEQA